MENMTGQNNELFHYGTPRHSGRYPWGSGENPYQHCEMFLNKVSELHKSGYSEKEIADALGISTSELRDQKSNAKAQKKANDTRRAMALKDKGYATNRIAQMMDMPESSVRNLLNPVLQERAQKNSNTADILKKNVDEKNYIDIGPGVEKEMGVTRGRLLKASKMLTDQGYTILYPKVEQATNPGKFTTITVLCKPGTDYKEIYEHKSEIKSIQDHSVDDGKTYYGLDYPKSIDSKRIYIRYAEDGGTEKDGLIELRRGVEDISLGKSAFAQVRIAVDDNLYAKGMAAYSDNIPDGYDIVVNSNKKSGTTLENVLKPMKRDKVTNEIDKDNPFGAVIKANGQRKYDDPNGEFIDPETGKRQSLSVINKVKEEGDWADYSKTLSPQFLSKQSKQLIESQLNLSYSDKKEEFDDIMSLNNPTVRRKLLDAFASDCDASAEHLKASPLPRQSTKVILPVTSLRDDEIYAPSYTNGEKLALIRFPHAGTFEIPVVTVNNKNKEGRKLMGTDAIDAVGINANVADRLSGADFDGDTVMVIPTNGSNGVKITSTPRLKGLEGFNTKSYAFTEDQFLAAGEKVLNRKIKAKDPKDIKILKEKVANGYSPTKEELISAGESELVIKPQTKQTQMGVVSNLITDMTLRGATTDELARAVRHSMVVIDAEKHKLDYKESERFNNIAQLREKYQAKDNGRSGGASTLISKAKSKAYDDEREDGAWVTDPKTGSKKRMYIDPKTGEKMYNYTGRSYIDKNGNEVIAKTETTKMSMTKDARTLSSGTEQEEMYANYANKLKDLANTARLAYLNAGKLEYNPSAAKIYSAEVQSLNDKLDKALLNAPKERQAQILAAEVVNAKIKSNPNMDSGDRKKARQQAIAAARAKTGASGKDSRINITENEWHAIQAGAISDTKLSSILDHSDLDRVREYATPKQRVTLSAAKQSKIKAMQMSGYTIDDIAKALGISASTVSKYIKK